MKTRQATKQTARPKRSKLEEALLRAYRYGWKHGNSHITDNPKVLGVCVASEIAEALAVENAARDLAEAVMNLEGFDPNGPEQHLETCQAMNIIPGYREEMSPCTCGYRALRDALRKAGLIA
jgi:hypothetical protein